MSLLRTCVVALVVALAGNVWLIALAPDSDTFANGVGVASGVIAALIVVAYVALPKLLGEAMLAAFALWVANLIEIATDDVVRSATQIRQGAFYAAFALIALGAYLGTRRLSP